MVGLKQYAVISGYIYFEKYKNGLIIENAADFGNHLGVMSVRQKSFDIMHLCIVPTRHTAL